MELDNITRIMPAPIRSLARVARGSIRGLATAARRRMVPARISHPSALPCVVASNEYGSYCVPYSSLHRPAAQAIMRGEVWEPATIKFMRENYDGGDIIHAGTYYGDFLPGLASALSPGAVIWAFEPNSENYRCATITVELNALRHQVNLAHAALGAADGSVMISVLDSSGRSLGGSSYVGAQGKQSVRQIALDGMIPTDRHISIVQFDVEGYEEMALRGCERLVRREKPTLILETVPTSEWFGKLLQDCGYQFMKPLAQNSVFVSTTDR